MKNIQVEDLHKALTYVGYKISPEEMDAKRFGTSTRDAVRAMQTSYLLPVSGIVDQKVADQINLLLTERDMLDKNGDNVSSQISVQPVSPDTRGINFAVRGCVMTSGGEPAKNTVIKAFDRNMGEDDTFLGKATSGAEGKYTLTFNARKLSGKAAADLVISIYQDGKLLQTSDVIFNAQTSEIRDFIIPVKTEPEFEQFTEKIRPLLRGKLSLSGLAKRETGFLSKKTGIDENKIGRLAQSYLLGNNDETIAAFYYGILSQDLQGHPDDLSSRSRASIEQALKRSISLNIIPEVDKDRLHNLIDTVLLKQRTDRLLKPAAAGQPPSLGDMLGTLEVDLPQGIPEKVANAVGEFGMDYRNVSQHLKDVGLDAAQVNKIERTLFLGELTLRNIPLMRHLHESLGDDHSKSLIPIGRDQWIDKAYTYGVPINSRLTPEEYAGWLETSVEKMHPTAVLAERIKSGDLVIARPGFAKEKLEAFFSSNPDFDILKSNIRHFMEKANLNGVDDKDELLQSLNNLQRVRKLTASGEEAGMLLNNRMDSALEIVAMGQVRFAQQLSGQVPTERTSAIFRKAKETHDFGLALMARFSSHFSPTSAAAMEHSVLQNAALEHTLKDFPTLQELMGANNHGDCDPNRSVLSPSAYFVDLMQFLKNAYVLETLLDRRPDLADLELSAENTDVELPYIDLVLEILENAIALPFIVPLDDISQTVEDELSQQTLSPVITNILQKTSLETIGSRLHADAVEKNFDFDNQYKWTVTDQQRRWTLDYEPGEVEHAGKKKPSGRQQTSGKRFAGDDFRKDIEGLNGRKVPPSVKSYLENLIKRDVRNRYFGLVIKSVSVIEPDQLWRVDYTLSAKVLVKIQGEQGTITVRTSGGEPVFNKTYSAPAVKAVRFALEKKEITGVLATIFSSSDGLVIEQVGPDFEVDKPGHELIHIEPESLVIKSLAYQTAGNSTDLKASPRNQNPWAYEILRTANYPWSLPFNLPLASVRACLERTGITRRQLIELRKPNEYFSDMGWVFEMLDISSEEARLITKVNPQPSIWSLWGLDQQVKDTDQISIFDASTGRPVNGTPLQVFSRVSILMQQARVTYDELQKILHTRFIAAPAFTIRPENTASNDLSPANLIIDNLKTSHLDRIHQFVRIWRKLGWTIEDIDFALYVFYGKVINSNCLVFLANLKRLAEVLGLSVREVTSWWDSPGANPWTYTPWVPPGSPQPRNLYEEVFLNPINQRSNDADLVLNSAKSSLEKSGIKLSDKVPVISAALGISQDDLKELLSESFKQSLRDNLSLGSLLSIYRIVGLVRALRISITDYFWLAAQMPYDLKSTTAADGTMPGLVAGMIKFCETVMFVQKSGFGVEELAYLLQHRNIFPASTVFLSPEQTVQKLCDIRSAIQTKLNAIDHQVIELIRSNTGGPNVLRQLTDMEVVTMDQASLSIGYVTGDSLSGITSDLLLADRGLKGSYIRWESSQPAVISPAGKVTRPDSSQDNVDVVLTAKIENNDASIRLTREFTLTVLKQLPDADQAAAVAASRLCLGYAAGDSPSAVTWELTLPLRGIHNATIIWSSIPSYFSKQTESPLCEVWKIDRPVTDENVTLKATITVDGAHQIERDFIIKVLKRLSAEETVEADAALLGIGYALGDSPYGVTRDLILLGKGINGSNITWESGDPTILGNDGKIVKRPGITGNNVSVVVKATISCADATRTDIKPITKVFYSPALLDEPIFDENRLANILIDQGIHQQLAETSADLLAGVFGLDVSVIKQLIASDNEWHALLHYTEDGKVQDGLKSLLDPKFLSADTDLLKDSAAFPHAYVLIYHLHKASLILSRLNVKANQLGWFTELISANPSDPGILDFSDLPVIKSDEIKYFESWLRLVILLQIRDSLPKMDVFLDKYMGADADQIAQVLADGLGLSPDLIKAAAAELGIPVLANNLDTLTFKGLLELLYVMKKLGTSIDDLNLLTDNWPEHGAASGGSDWATQAETAAHELLRRKYGSDTWRDLIKPISDKLRAKQRDALMDYLIHLYPEEFQNANQLYEYYLIDPQMSPGMLTSRLVQAIAAIQLFVQQCQLNLLRDTVFNEDAIKRWSWMKNYRVWQANREVFLYPENWLYPELRDDKTEIFRQLESGIAQDEASYKLAKDNLLLYVDEIAEIAKIKVYGMYCDTDNTLYVVGRTPDQPYNYYWRKCKEFGAYGMHWYGWEKIELDIADDHVMPFVLDGNFYIAWPTITRKDSADPKNPSDDTKVVHKWEIKLNWVRYTSKGWSQKKVTRDADSIEITIPGLPSEVNPLNYCTFRLFYPVESPQVIDFVVYLASEIVQPTELPITPPFTASSSGAGTGSQVAVKVIELIKDTGQYYNADNYTVSLTTRSWYWKLNPGGQYAGDGTNGEWEMYTDFYEQKVTAQDGTCSFTLDQSFAQAELRVALVDGKAVYQYYPQQSNYPAGEGYTEHQKSNLQDLVDNASFNCIVEITASTAPKVASSMKIQGKFRLNVLTDMVKSTDTSGPALPSLEHVTQFYNNGYRSPVSGGNRFELTVNQMPAPQELCIDNTPLPKWPSDNSGDFFVIESGKANRFKPNTGLVYYSDSAKTLYVCGQDASDWFAIPDNIIDTAGLRLSHPDFDGADGFYSITSQSREDGNLIELHNKSADCIKEKNVGFNLQNPSALYNWEIFCHAPMLIAEYLTKNQRFEDAQRWLHYLFDPTATILGDVKQYWQFLPFREAEDSLNELFRALVKLVSNQWLTADEKSLIKDLNNQINDWLASPFSPFAVARFRWNAFQWRTIFTYLDNLIAWGDQAFRRFTRESVNEALLYYILASKLLGPRPDGARLQEEETALTYRDVYGNWDEYWKDWYNVTNGLALDTPPLPANNNGEIEALISLGMSCFCIPYNDKLTLYWDKVEDRLFKIRNCMDLEGTIQNLPLFAPPIDPALLVRAAAAGLDINAVLDEMSAPLLPYRFNILAPKANELCAEVKALGSALISALEKKDAEELALLRSSQEIQMLNLMTYLKEQQIKEASANLDVLNQNMALAKEKLFQYQKLVGSAALSYDQSGLPVLSTSSSLQVAAKTFGEFDGLGLIQHEVDQLKSLDEAHKFQEMAGIINTIAGVLHAIPESQTGAICQYLHIGGMHLGNAANAVASVLNILSNNASHEANKKGMFAQYQRRQDEWVFQSNLAVQEMRQINKQMIAAEIQKAIAERELENHKKQIENTMRVDEFMHDKYTNRELYSWMAGEISSVFFSSYQLAADMAKRAEKAFRFELGVEDTNFIQYGYWDSLKKGLLSGEKLSLDLKRMETAYLEMNRREYEVTKHISLIQIDPLALLSLRETGTCELSIPEALFDIDFPGHYFRRIKSMSLTIPCVTGPYTSVSCSLSLLKHGYRRTSLVGTDGYPHRTDSMGVPCDDDRFVESAGMLQSIATSHGQNDSGMFELNFRDERYLPFEGAGAISTWRIKLPSDVRQFDFNTISDVILHLKYTAREGGEILSAKAAGYVTELAKQANENIGRVVLLSVRHQFPSEWARFLTNSELALDIKEEHFPFWSSEYNKQITNVTVLAMGKEGTVRICKDTTEDDWVELTGNPRFGNMLAAELKQEWLAIFNNQSGWPKNMVLCFDNHQMDDIWLAVSWKG